MTTVEQQIEQSQAKKKALVRNALLGFVGVAALGGGGAFIVSQIPTTSSPVTLPVQAEVEKIEGLGAMTPPQVSAGDHTAHNIDRAGLQRALTETKQAIAPVIAETKDATAFMERASALDEKMESAYFAYGGGDYELAQRLINEIKQEVKSLADDFEIAYTTPYQQAQTAFDHDNVAAAIELNRQSLLMNPNYPPAQALQRRIAVYAQVQDAYEQARVGKVENNLNKQREALATIVKLDPARTDAKARLDQVEATLAEIRFQNALGKATSALDQGNYQQAQALLADAAKINPHSPELVAIQKRVSQDLKLQGQVKAEQQVTVFTAADEWLTVKMMAEKGLKEYPTSPLLQQALQSAKQILAAEQAIDEYAAQPRRLADENVRGLAQADIASFDSLRDLSAKLSAKLDNLNELIDEQNQPLPVIITSDDRTYIKVLGVGIVGETDEKVVKLKPGRYKVEGSRRGYRSKIVDLVVTPSDEPITIHIECDERV